MDGWPEIDTSVAHVTRVYDYLLGGRANFAVDREAAERAYAAWPGVPDRRRPLCPCVIWAGVSRHQRRWGQSRLR